MSNNYHEYGGQSSSDYYRRRGDHNNRNGQHHDQRGRGGQREAWEQGGEMQLGGQDYRYNQGPQHGQHQQYEILLERRQNNSNYGLERPNYGQNPYGGQNRDYPQRRDGGRQDGRNDGFDHHQLQDDNGYGGHQRRSLPRRDGNYQGHRNDVHYNRPLQDEHQNGEDQREPLPERVGNCIDDIGYDQRPYSDRAGDLPHERLSHHIENHKDDNRRNFQVQYLRTQCENQLQQFVDSTRLAAQQLDTSLDLPSSAIIAKPIAPIQTWDELELPPILMDNIHAMGFESPRNVQKTAIPHFRFKKNMIIQSESGTGKTVAYAIPIIDFILKMDPELRAKAAKGRYVVALVIAPTRYLVNQIGQVFQALCHRTNIGVWVASGAEIFTNNVDGCHILVGTSNQVLNIQDINGSCWFTRLVFLVLEEAEKQFEDMRGMDGAVNDIEALPHVLFHGNMRGREKMQAIFVSSTIGPAIRKEKKGFFGIRFGFTTISNTVHSQEEMERLLFEDSYMSSQSSEDEVENDYRANRRESYGDYGSGSTRADFDNNREGPRDGSPYRQQDYDLDSEESRIEIQVEKFIMKTASLNLNLDPSLDLDLDVDIPNYRTVVKRWADMGVEPVLMANIGRMGLTTPRKVQKVAIPLLLANYRNLVIRSESGTGKTMCFAVPIVQWILEMNPRDREKATEKGIVLALVLEPTRELVGQVGTAIRALCIGTGIKVHVAHGGSGPAGNEYEAGKGCLIVVTTINEVYRMQQQNYMSFDLLEFLIFDEAEKLFLDARPTPRDPKLNEKLIDVLNHKNMTSLNYRRNVLVSSTRAEGFGWALTGFLKEVQFISVSIAGRRQLSPRINMRFHNVIEAKKNELLRALIENDPSKKVLVFCKSIDACAAVLPFLDHLGAVVFPSDQIQEDSERGRALIRFNKGEIRILIATNVLARGLDFHNLEKIIIFDLVDGLTDGFIHRCGRVGRLSPGDVHVFVDRSDKKLSSSMLKRIDLMTMRQGKKECVPTWMRDLYAILDSAKAGSVSSSGPISSNLPISKQHAVENENPNDAQALPQEEIDAPPSLNSPNQLFVPISPTRSTTEAAPTEILVNHSPVPVSSTHVISDTMMMKTPPGLPLPERTSVQMPTPRSNNAPNSTLLDAPPGLPPLLTNSIQREAVSVSAPSASDASRITPIPTQAIPETMLMEKPPGLFLPNQTPVQLSSPLINSTPETTMLQMSSELPHLPLPTAPIQGETVSVSVAADSDQLSLVDKLVSLILFLFLYLVSAFLLVPRQLQNAFVWAIRRDSENAGESTGSSIEHTTAVERAVVKENMADSKGRTSSRNMRRRNKKK